MDHVYKYEPAKQLQPDKKNIFFQPKLTINNPNDEYEKEADAMADKVMRMEQPFIQPKSLAITSVQRTCAHCEEEDKKAQRKEINGNEATPDHLLESYVANLNGGGQQLPNEIRNFYEPRFRYDFSNVRVHTDPVAAKSAQSINALAYTSGGNIVFNSGQYSPDTDSGKRLLGHELTHVLQQSNMNSAKVMRQEAPGPRSRLRIPILETAALQFGALGSSRYPLTDDQVRIATTIFQGSINYSAVRIVESNIISAPTTLGNNIRIAPGYRLDSSTLIHELTHIWQFQNHGLSYISDSLVHQLAGILGSGDRNAAYSYTIIPGRPFANYTAEQQAMIVEDFYRQPSKRSDLNFQRLIAEVRRATPAVRTDLDLYRESMYGPSYGRTDMFNQPGSGGSGDRQGGTVPLIRYEF
jgi:Domain of unknown function (DUF4157)